MPAKIYLNIQNYVVTENINYTTAHEDHGRALEKTQTGWNERNDICANGANCRIRTTVQRHYSEYLNFVVLCTECVGISEKAKSFSFCFRPRGKYY